jgi:hypothetical protein
MPFQVTILEVDLDAYKADPPTPSGLPPRFCACCDPFWIPKSFREKYILKAFGDTEEAAILALKTELRKIMRYERIRSLNEVEVDL